ncbi:MAG: FAD-binding oxidoreductase, partial [Bdellovibrionales bacterium]|nr:FAD-binding oxidoreductase [Bdellovibrionales bacterium]
EGTLGFVTEATLTLTKKPEELRVMLLGVQDLTAVLNIYQEFRSQLPLTAYEMFTDRALSCVLHQGTLKNPLETPCPFYVLLEFENGSEKTLDLSMQLFEQAMEKEWVVDGTLSQNAQQAKEIWRLREDISEATAPYQPYKNDISVRISDVTSFLEELHQLLGQKYPNFEVVWFGHIGDGNLHINILKPSELSSEEFLNKCHEVDEVLFKMIARYKGSISAEHGVGLTKKPYLAFTRSLEEIQIMREIKKVFDPDGIINPGKIFDP